MGPQVSTMAIGMREEREISNTEEIELVLVVSRLSFWLDVKCPDNCWKL